MNKKILFILISLSLLAGVGLAGGLYVISTPTNLTPKASELSRPNPAVATPQRVPTERVVDGSGERTAGASPAPSGPLTRQEIIASFGQNSPRADLNADGLVNSLDLAAFDLKNK